MSKREMIERMIRISEPDLTEELAQALKRPDTNRPQVTKAIEGVFAGLRGVRDGEKSTRVKKSVRESLLIPLDLDLSEEIEDKGLREAVRIIQKRVIGNSQKDSLVRSLARELYDDWKKMSADELDLLVGEEGYLTNAVKQAREWSDLDSLAENITSAGKLLGVWFWDRFEQRELEQLVEGAKTVLDGLLAGTDMFAVMGETARLFLESGRIMKSMRSAFAGLLVGDLVLSAVGPAVGLKKGASVTDAIVDIGVKVAQKEHLAEADPERLRDFRSRLESV